MWNTQARVTQVTLLLLLLLLLLGQWEAYQNHCFLINTADINFSSSVYKVLFFLRLRVNVTHLTSTLFVFFGNFVKGEQNIC
jgi:hypothetical protein